MNLIAINTISRAVKPGKAATRDTPAVPPKIETIAPGEKFGATKEEADELIGMKAAREDKDTPQKKSATAENTKTSSTAAAAQQAENGTPKAPEDMTVAEIKAELDELEAEYASDALKDDLVKALTEARSADLV